MWWGGGVVWCIVLVMIVVWIVVWIVVSWCVNLSVFQVVLTVAPFTVAPFTVAPRLLLSTTAGTCSAMFTANTMSSAIEALGMAVPGSSSRPALYPSKEVVDASVAGENIYV